LGDPAEPGQEHRSHGDCRWQLGEPDRRGRRGLYRHFDNKEDLFVAVIQTACKANQLAEEPPWLDLSPLEGLTQAGSGHLAFVLSAEQVALYRVVTREAQRFPELGQRYQIEVVGDRAAQLIRCFDHWPKRLRTRSATPVMNVAVRHDGLGSPKAVAAQTKARSR
jgi:AcrR family transcriptional regulator